jgi:hypothetical protein
MADKAFVVTELPPETHEKLPLFFDIEGSNQLIKVCIFLYLSPSL